MKDRYPAELAPTKELLDEVAAQKGTGVVVGYEKESDLFYFTPIKKQPKQSPNTTKTSVAHSAALFPKNPKQDEKSIEQVKNEVKLS